MKKFISVVRVALIWATLNTLFVLSSMSALHGTLKYFGYMPMHRQAEQLGDRYILETNLLENTTYHLTAYDEGIIVDSFSYDCFRQFRYDEQLSEEYVGANTLDRCDNRFINQTFSHPVVMREHSFMVEIYNKEPSLLPQRLPTQYISEYPFDLYRSPKSPDIYSIGGSIAWILFCLVFCLACNIAGLVIIWTNWQKEQKRLEEK